MIYRIMASTHPPCPGPYQVLDTHIRGVHIINTFSIHIIYTAIANTTHTHICSQSRLYYIHLLYDAIHSILQVP